MIETRFKDTEVGRIPEDWEVNTIGEISDVKTGPFGSALHSDDYVLNGVPIITVEHIGQINIDISNGVPKVGESDYQRLNSYVLKKNDLVFSRVGSVDRCSYVSDNEDGWLFSGRLLRVRLKRNIDSLYLTYHLQTDDAKNRVVSVAVGLAMPSINTKILSGVSVVFPKDKSEQTRIATTLSNIDALILELGKLIEKKRAIKQGAMQQLLTGKRRLKGFTEPWGEKELGELLQYEQPTKYLVSSTDYSDNGVPVLTAGKTFILGYTKESSGIYDNLPVIIFDDFVTESKYVDFPFKAKSSAMKMLTLKNDNNNLRFVFEIMQMIDFPMTDHKRWWIGEYCHIVVKIPSFDEQNAIASVLSSMDEEILALEAKQDKYAAIKQGMMQQLLTGKIRLIENVAKPNVTSANVYFRRSVLAAEIADRLCDEPTFGHVKMEKILFLTEHLCHIDIGSHYHRDAAGPYDNTALRSIDSQLKKQKWFEVKRTEKGNWYVPMQNRGKHRTYFNRYYSDVLPTFDRIVDTFKSQRTEQCEIVATLYSAWEDLLHSNKPFTDSDIVNEVLNNWHESKKRIPQDRWLKAILWMRKNGFAPDNNNN